MKKSNLPLRLRDQLGNADLTRTSAACTALVDSLQNQEGLLAGEFLAAVTAAFILTTEASGMSAQDIISLTKNIMADAYGRRGEFKAVKDYIEQEVY